MEENNEPLVNEVATPPAIEIEKNDGKIRFLLEEEENEVQEQEDIQKDNNLFGLKDDSITENQKSIEQKEAEPKEISEERLDRIRKATQKLRSPLGLNEMENEPAYKRRNVELDEVKESSDPSISRYTLWENEDDNGDKQTGLSDNNSFLHDNVD